MNITKILIPAAAALALAGCSTVRPGCTCDTECGKKCCEAPYVDKADPVVGNWSATLPFDDMNAASLIFSRGPKGEAKAVVLFRWGSPLECTDVSIVGSTFSFRHPYGWVCRGSVDGDDLEAEIAGCDKDGKAKTKFESFDGYRNVPACPCASTKTARFDRDIDLLADGLNGWKTMNPQATFGWSFKDGILSNRIGGNADIVHNGRVSGANLMTKRADFGDFQLSYDVRVPKNCNSGVYLRGRYEIQVVDSYGQKVDCHNMAAVYGRVTPSVAAEKAPGEWQHVDITFANRHITVVLNGVTIIDDVEIVGVTGGAIDADLDAAGPIYLQGDHSDADYKNMILRPMVK